jgi:hypothetical protein
MASWGYQIQIRATQKTLPFSQNLCTSGSHSPERDNLMDVSLIHFPATVKGFVKLACIISSEVGRVRLLPNRSLGARQEPCPPIRPQIKKCTRQTANWRICANPSSSSRVCPLTMVSSNIKLARQGFLPSQHTALQAWRDPVRPHRRRQPLSVKKATIFREDVPLEREKPSIFT